MRCVVADDRRVEVVVHLRRDLDRRRVQAGLVRERRGTDVGRVRVRREVGDLGDRVRDALHLGQAAVGQHVAAHLRDQPADDAEDVRVAGALAVPVRRALDVRRAGIHGGQGVGHRATRVVLGVDAEPDAGATAHVRTRRRARPSAACRRWCRTGRRRRRRPRPRRRARARRSRGRAGSRRRSARSRRTRGVPRRAGTRPCRAPSRGSPPAWCAARRSTCHTVGLGHERDDRARASRAARAPAGRPRPARRPCGSPRTPPARRSSARARRRRRGRRTRCPWASRPASRPR